MFGAHLLKEFNTVMETFLIDFLQVQTIDSWNLHVWYFLFRKRGQKQPDVIRYICKSVLNVDSKKYLK